MLLATVVKIVLHHNNHWQVCALIALLVINTPPINVRPALAVNIKINLD
jgi:hypothetical protein